LAGSSIDTPEPSFQKRHVAWRSGSRLDPDTVHAQIQSAVIFDITAALYGQITLKDGRVGQSNFDSYQMLRMNKAPAIEGYIIQGSEPPGGIGEAGTSAIVPTVTNAIFAATGQRLRKLPIDPHHLEAASVNGIPCFGRKIVVEAWTA
jgi:isoquinoline 1-oxidoreductase beta subunit